MEWKEKNDEEMEVIVLCYKCGGEMEWIERRQGWLCKCGHEDLMPFIIKRDQETDGPLRADKEER